MKTVGIKDFETYTFLSGISCAPDGKKAVFSVHSCAPDERGYVSDFWVYENGQTRQLTSSGNCGFFLWEDDSHILFPALRREEEKRKAESGSWFTSFYRMSLYGGEPVPAFTAPFQVQKAVKYDDETLIMTGTIEQFCPDYYQMSEEERRIQEQRRKEEEDYEVIEESPFWRDGGTFLKRKRTALFLCRWKTGQYQRLTAPDFQTESFCVIDGIVYYTGRSFDRLPGGKSELWMYDVCSNTVRCLNAKKDYAISDLLECKGRLFCLASEQKRYGESENPFFYEADRQTGELKLYCAYPETVSSSVNCDCCYGSGKYLVSAGEEIYFSTTVRDHSELWKIQKDGQAVPLVTEQGTVNCFDVFHDGVILMAGMYGQELAELYEVRDGKPVKKTCFNEEKLKDTYVAAPERVTCFSAGWQIDGWVLRPADFDPDKRYPAILNIHGGPKTVFGEVFHHEMQYWAGKGYFVFYCNPFGSDGRGNEFADLRGKYGTIDYQNLMDFTDTVLKNYPQIDESRLAVTGGSYGGFMTNWIVGHTDRFACAGAQRSISNFMTMYGISDIGKLFVEDQICKDLWQDLEKVWQQSPLKYAKQAKTPLLLVHSAEDYRCPASEAMQMYTALVQRGIPARLVLIRGECHSLSRCGMPARRVRRLKELTDWFDRYTKEKG